MVHRRTMLNINRIHESARIILYQDNTSTFEELFNKGDTVKIHTQNLQVLATEIFKVKNGRALP